ncbi:g-type lectin s-receptor-like serine/threonine-protein kinase at1g11300 [Phtheirospermum japonicum]|uniref:non-specific serine/threonine protein kinase n=1 Tax=Phtheirospermum japonicum TaxID=374723 RepID=A0A830DKE0_9LAMI|nr:g-type lectin s-receptor-like serine/threonine-protein kinase at1g11300 [Phtheirospermum japonicum]
MFWSETLIDIQQFDGVGPDFHLCLASSELDSKNDKRLVIIIPVAVGVAFLCICVLIACWWMVKRKGKKIKDQKPLEILQSDSTAIVLKDESEKVNIEELPLFTFKTFADATNQFHEDNMLGSGGFGHVYKGTLANGKQIAVKRLSETSGQGAEEFRNEAVVISKVQHRNLVKLLGCCAEGEEKMLVYDGYMAPEYAIDGRFSEKSDVYSFGVLMLEIAWKLWNEGNGIAFADQTIANPSFEAEIVRCIHIALLCVQEFLKDRPSVQTVVSMLNHEIVDLPLPEQPVFADKWVRSSTRTTSQNGYSINELTVTPLGSWRKSLLANFLTAKAVSNLPLQQPLRDRASPPPTTTTRALRCRRPPPPPAPSPALAPSPTTTAVGCSIALDHHLRRRPPPPPSPSRDKEKLYILHAWDAVVIGRGLILFIYIIFIGVVGCIPSDVDVGYGAVREMLSLQ